MKRVILLLLCLLLPLLAMAEPQIRASLQSDIPSPYVNQPFNLALVVEWSEAELASNYQIMGMPDASLVELGTPQEMPSDSFDENGITFQRRRFMWKTRAKKSGTIHLTPTLRVGVMTRQQSFIGFSSVFMGHDVAISPTQFAVRDLPPPDPSSAFSGAIGRFDFSVTPSATNISIGDLIELRMDIRGDGFMANITPPLLAAAENVKAYPPKAVESPDAAVFVQTVVPQRAVPEIGRLTFCYFDPIEGQYVTKEAGPFPLSYHDRTTEERTQYIPSMTSAPPAQTRALSAVNEALKAKEVKLRTAASARLSPTASSMVLFEIPAGSGVRVIRIQSPWLMVESQNRRGWIPESSIE